MPKLPQFLIDRYKDQAQIERSHGSSAVVDPELDLILVKRPGVDIHIIHGPRATVAIESVPDGIEPEDYFLALSQSW